MTLTPNGKLWLFEENGVGCSVDLETEDTESSSIIDFSLDLPISNIIDIVDEKDFIVLSSVSKVGGEPANNDRRYLLKHTLIEGSSSKADNSSNDSKRPEASKDSNKAAKWKTSVISFVDNFRNFAVSNNKKYFVFTRTSNFNDLVVAGELDSEYNLVSQMPPIKRKHKTSALAISSSGVAAVGSLGGAIDLYYNITDKDRPASLYPRALKWHIDPAKALSFSLDGDYLLSGGNERVLVFWQLDTGRSQFLPRLNGDITGIVVDPSSELYAIQMGDNEIVVFSSLDLLSRLQVAGVKAEPPTAVLQQQQATSQKIVPPAVSSSFYINPRTKHAYFSLSYGSFIQAYDTQRDEQVGVVTVAPALQAGKVKVEATIKDPVVTQISFTQDGKWMATVDEYMPPTIDRLLSRSDMEINLKFWRFVEGNWVLTTRVSAPHGNNVKVKVVPAGSKFNNGHAFLTVGANGGLRLWMPHVPDTEEDEKTKPDNTPASKAVVKSGPQPTDVKYTWSVRRNIPSVLHNPTNVAAGWSADGSVVILALGNLMYIIDGETFEMKATLPNIVDTPVVSIEIVNSKLVVLSQSRLIVYDLINCVQVWSLGLSFSDGEASNMFAVDPATGVIAVAINSHLNKTHASRVYLFSLDSPVPLDVQQYKDYVSSIQYIPGSTSTFQILTPELRFTTLSPTISTTIPAASKVEEQNVDSFEASLASLYSSAQPVHSTRRAYVPDFDSASEAITMSSFDSVFDDATTDVASMSKLFDRVMGVISLKN